MQDLIMGNETKKAGRPRRIQTPGQFKNLADLYFDDCDQKNEKYTITGLALALGLCSRVELYDYCEYEEFKDVATRARARVENCYEKRLQEGKPVGAIFALKNMGWRDERHVDVKSSDGSMSPNKSVTLDVSKLTTDQLAAVWGAMIVKDIDDARASIH